MGYYAKAKVYSDGSHYIAIPHTTRPKRPKRVKKEACVIVDENNKVLKETEEISTLTLPSGFVLTEVEWDGKDYVPVKKKVTPKGTKISKKDLFEKLYEQTKGKSRSERKQIITDSMKDCFESYEKTQEYVNDNFDRKLRNLICRRIRMCRKAYLNGVNYFCTFTYDDKLHTEESFKKKLKWCLAHFAKRKGWKYMGVWERGGKTDRLHFHALMYIPPEDLEGKLIEKKEYDFKSKDMKITYSHTFFEKKFGRNDFKIIPSLRFLGENLAYLMKYMEKSGEKIVYSRGMAQFIVSDILDDDIICPMGDENEKLILFDNFTCIDEGEIIGTMSPETLKKMPKAN